jgi:hypothetical protein
MSKRIIHFTAYIRPNGKTERRSWVLNIADSDKELLELKLADIKKVGLDFTYEDLGNGMSNICLENKNLPVRDYDSRVCRTNPKDIKDMVLKMINLFDLSAYERLANRKEGA